MHFDEKSMFAGNKLEAATLKVRTAASGSRRGQLVGVQGWLWSVGKASDDSRVSLSLSGGVSPPLQKHLQDHGLCRLQQVSPVGETTGEALPLYLLTRSLALLTI